MEQEKTVLEWFTQAIRDGHDWGAKAIVEAARLSNGKRLQRLMPSLSEALWNSFTWENSGGFENQGAAYYFWEKIYDSIVETEN